jgi:hypothetical protein
MMRGLAILLLALPPQEGVEEAVLKLGSDRVQEREEAQRAIRAHGEKALPALRSFLQTADEEGRARARALIVELDRAERERLHDAEEWKRLLEAAPRPPAGRTDCRAVEGGYFQFFTRPSAHGTIVGVVTHSRDVRFRYDVLAEDEAGRPVAVERCGRCSPPLFLARADGPVKVKLVGMRHWNSAYTLEFKDPKDGDRREVGDLSIEVAWPRLKITASSDYPESDLQYTAYEFSFGTRAGEEPKEELEFVSDKPFKGKAPDGGPIPPPKGWCDCPEGPRPIRSAGKTARTATVEHGEARKHRREDVAWIRCRFRKPMAGPFDVEAPVFPLKR